VIFFEVLIREKPRAYTRPSMRLLSMTLTLECAFFDSPFPIPILQILIARPFHPPAVRVQTK
jgi:hypothetical protein